MAQTSRGTIAGTVTDQTGAVVIGAKVTATDSLTSESRTTTTNDTGGFRFDAITPGVYNIEITAATFAPMRLEKLPVPGSVVTSVNPKMKLGASTETVNVIETGEQVQTESGELSKVITQQQITELPIPSLNAYQLALTLPGVVSVSSRDDFTNGTSYSVNGLRPRANNFLIDGFDNNDNAIQGQGLQPQNVEAISQVTVFTNSYAAEFGRGGASVTNVQFRSGNNGWHGGVWEQYQGSRLDALTTTQAQSGLDRVPQYVQNLFGFRLGGPIVKNKLFVFGTSQWTRFFGAFQGSTLTLPTATGYDTLAAVAAANPGTVQNQIDLLAATTGVTWV
ncbi:MAG: Plug and carboxypeptidase regulatory-like domain-containing protein [Acidobacteriota bacterium]|nr:Plug and carboxypeptidase regulatory-like domain-containing protein [Acidobacteriota bacterium]